MGKEDCGAGKGFRSVNEVAQSQSLQYPSGSRRQNCIGVSSSPPHTDLYFFQGHAAIAMIKVDDRRGLRAPQHLARSSRLRKPN